MHFVEETKSMISDSLFQQLKDFTKEVELEASVRKAKSGKSGMTRNVLIQNSQLTIHALTIIPHILQQAPREMQVWQFQRKFHSR
jgi:hypothetical protein